MTRATREWVCIFMGLMSPVLLAIACFWFAAWVEHKHHERQPLEEVELDVRPMVLTDRWFFCNHVDEIGKLQHYLNCIEGIQARIDF